MAFMKAHLLPLLMNIIFGGTFLTTYTIAVKLNHVRALFPYISDTGNKPPESTIFSQFLNIGCIFAFLTMYAKYLYLNTCYLRDPSLSNYVLVQCLNRISIWIAPFMCLGASMAANFQPSSAIIPHLFGAFMSGGGGITYFALQTYISYKACPVLNTMRMAHFRLVLTVLAASLGSTTVLSGAVSLFMFTRSLKYVPVWGPDDGGYGYHLLSTVTEWALAFVFGIYYSTFSSELRNVVIKYPTAEPRNLYISIQHNSCFDNAIQPVDAEIQEENRNEAFDTGREIPTSVYPE
ncbi:DNA damage-regulated autophagy modulator protein 1-like [Centruroides sculpturatus]|uniref:DNA damage-regulated autophagy modulator protein 1-like n=1 Tax=Centruroides sculpturatus TaxID=218467 RepID=UPI000C6CC88F|nr:DNA damage-regulated autophagy modulator protein 1-like [Centruroides sculpturatus]